MSTRDNGKTNEPDRKNSQGLSRRSVTLGGIGALSGVLTGGRSLAGEARGEPIVRPGDSRYRGLRAGYNLRFIGEPAGIWIADSPEETMRGVQYAIDNGLRLTAKSGGHCYEGFVTETDGLILDLGLMNKVYVDRQRGLAVVEGGATLWPLYKTLLRTVNRTLPAGSCYSVGAGGHITGGGYGLLSRLHGLVVDYLWGAELVVVDDGQKARRITVTQDSSNEAERDLLFAVRGGGGGQFGVVTRFLFRIDDLPKPPARVALTHLAWDWARLDESAFTGLVDRYANICADIAAPTSDATGVFTLFPLSHRSAGQIGLTIQEAEVPGVPLGDVTQRIISELTKVGGEPVTLTTPLAHSQVTAKHRETRILPWIKATQTLAGIGPTQRSKAKSAYMLKPFPRNQLATIYAHLNDADYSNPNALLQVDSYGGAVNSVAPDATAIPQRSSAMILQYQTYWKHVNDDAEHLEWIRRFYKAVYADLPNQEPTPGEIMDGCYVNYPDSDLTDAPTLYYKGNLGRLRRAKRTWDPTNVFNHAQSI